MYCNNVRCVDRGYCTCHNDITAEAAGGCGGIFIYMFVGIFAAFLYPAIRISRANFKYEANGFPKFAGAVWLLISPLFGFIATMLYQVVFAMGACAAGKLDNNAVQHIYVAGFFTLLTLATGLAVIAFLIKNRKQLKSLITEPEARSIGKISVLVALPLLAILTVVTASKTVSIGMEGYSNLQTEIKTTGNQKDQLISNKTVKLDSYVGTYKSKTRSNKESFVVTISDDGKNLRLIRNEVRPGKENDFGCLLTQNVDGNSVYYSVSECEMKRKTNSLEKVFFNKRKNKVKMSLIYSGETNGDTLEKVR